MNDPVATAFNLKEYFNSSLSPLQIIFTLLAALVLGAFIYFVYKKTFGGVLYSRSFNLSLILLTMVTTLVLMIIGNNLTMSLGMVGALSIIRFRTAVKDPMDTTYMFWAVGEGLALGAQFFDVALISAVVIGLIMVLLTSFKTRSSMPYLLIIHYHEAASGAVKGLIRQLPKSRLKSKTVQRDGVELTLEVRLRDEETGAVDKFMRIDGVYDATLISHQGELVS